jgi:hypothetical protein
MAESKPHSANEYSSTQAPETQKAAHGPREHDYRMIPGGHPSRAKTMVGMESVDQDENASRNAGHQNEE